MRSNHNGRKWKVRGLARSGANQTYFIVDEGTPNQHTTTVADGFFSNADPNPDPNPNPGPDPDSDPNPDPNPNPDPHQVALFFQRAYNIQLQLPHLPCLLVGKENSSLEMPIELCTFLKGQKNPQLSNEQKARMIYDL